MKKTRSGGFAGLMFGLAGGIVIGSFGLAPSLQGGSGYAAQQLQQEKTMLQQQDEVHNKQLQSADIAVEKLFDSALVDALKDKRITIISTPETSTETVDAFVAAITQAGGQSTSILQLQEKFFAQASADELKNYIALSLPAGEKLNEDIRDAGTHSGDFIGGGLFIHEQADDPVVQAAQEHRAEILGELKKMGFVDYAAGEVVPADAIIFLSGHPEEEFAQLNQASFARSLAKKGPVVVGATLKDVQGSGVLAMLRSNEPGNDQLSTVDSIDRQWGKLAVILAIQEKLTGGHGAYGAGAQVTDVFPRIVQK